MAAVAYRFLAYVRSGFAASIAQPDTFGAGQPALATAPTAVTVSDVTDPVRHTVTVRGPGDMIGLVASQVVRTDPIDGAVGVEPSYFAQIEFDRPDLRWMLTPAAGVGDRCGRCRTDRLLGRGEVVEPVVDKRPEPVQRFAFLGGVVAPCTPGGCSPAACATTRTSTSWGDTLKIGVEQVPFEVTGLDFDNGTRVPQQGRDQLHSPCPTTLTVTRAFLREARTAFRGQFP